MSKIHWNVHEYRNTSIKPKYEILKLNIFGVLTHETVMVWSKKKEDWVSKRKKYKTPLVHIECQLQVDSNLKVNQLYQDEWGNKWISITENILAILNKVENFTLPKEFLYLSTIIAE